MYDYSKLYGKIREVYGTQEAFAAAIGMHKATLSLRLTGKKEWKLSEVISACELLKIPFEEAHLYFFVRKAVKFTAREA